MTVTTRRPAAGFVFPSALGRILLAPDADPPAGDDKDKDKDKDRPRDDPKDKAPTLDDMRRKVEERGVDYAARMLLEMSEDNYKLRDANRELRARVPGDDAVVLRGEDARRWHQYGEIGLAPADVKKLREEHGTLASWKKGREQADRLDGVATLYGWKPPVLRRLAAGLDVEGGDHPTEKDKDGKPVRVKKGFVVTRGDDGQESGRRPLDEYAEANWKDDLDALKGPPVKSTAADREDPRRPVPKGDDPLARELAPSRLL